jgi:GNAT superfamily N-acetyltransferase
MNAYAHDLRITVRETSPADLDEVLMHRRMMFYDMGYQDSVVLDKVVNSSRPFLENCLSDLCYRGWFAIAGGSRVAAGAGLLVTPWVSHPLSPDQTHKAYLLNVYTYPEFRKRGLARLLAQKAIEWCRQDGYKVLWLHASEHGRSIYESLGFQATNEMKLIIE